MNFKRLRGIAAAAFACFAAALLAGCMNPMAGSVDSSSRMATLSLSATGIPNEYAEQFEASYPTAARATASARSITPNDPFDIGKIDDDNSQSKGLVFYLSGSATTGKKLADIEVEIKAKTGTDPVEYEYQKKDGSDVAIDSLSWNLVLTAYKKYTSATATDNEPVLRGYCSIDLRNGSGTASFTLSPENLTTPGKVTITGKIPTYNNVASYTMGIYKMDSYSTIIKADALKSETVTDTTAEIEFKYEYESVEPGSYLYKMIFKNSANVITGSFIDTLIVDPGNALVRDLGTLDIINEPPKAPTDFKANLVKDSETSDGTYQVKLSWKRTGGETNFEIELTEYTKGDDGNLTAVADHPKIYGMKSMDLGTSQDSVIDFQGSDVWAGKGGAMTYGEEEAYLKLKLGTLYDVRIRARNYFGVSKDANNATDGWTKRSASINDADGNEGYADSEKINRMKIEYNLNGGTLRLSNGAGDYTNYTGTYTEYKSWKGADLNLLVIDIPETGTNTHRLKKSGSPFVEWRTDVKNDTSGTTTADYKNLSVTAFYGSSITGSVGMADAKKDIALSDIKIYHGTKAAPETNEITVTAANAIYVIPKDTSTTPKEPTNLRIVLKTDTNTYTNIRFEMVRGEDVIPLATGVNACTIALDEYDAGKFEIRVIADTVNAKGMSQALTFDLE